MVEITSSGIPFGRASDFAIADYHSRLRNKLQALIGTEVAGRISEHVCAICKQEYLSYLSLNEVLGMQIY